MTEPQGGSALYNTADVSFQLSCNGNTSAPVVGASVYGNYVLAPQIGLDHDRDYEAVYIAKFGGPAQADVTVDPSLCGTGTGRSADQNFEVLATATVTDPGGTTVTTTVSGYELDIPVVETSAAPCSDSGAGAGDAQVMRSDPVATATGGCVEVATDASVQAPGVPVAVTRSYSSMQSAAGPLGPGWSLPWFASAAIQPDGGVVITDENGDQFDYALNSDGSYAGPAGARSVLTATSAGWTWTAPDHSQLGFDSSGQLAWMRDGTGRGLTMSYTAGQLTGVTDAAGAALTLSYDSGGQLTGIALPGGGTVSYTYSSGGMLAGVTDAAGNVTSYAYTPAGLLASATDGDGNVQFVNVYDSSGRVTQQTDAAGNVTSFAYTDLGDGQLETDMTDPDGGIWTDVYGGGLLVESIDPAGDETGQVPNQFLQQVSSTDQDYVTTTATYDASGDQTSQTDGNGSTQSWAYDASGDMTSYTSADGNLASYTYNTMNEPTSVTAAGGGQTTYTYDSAGRLTSETGPRGNAAGATPTAYTTTYAYNSAGQLVSQTDPMGRVTRDTYDAMGNLASQTDPMGNVTSYAYDGDGRLLAVTQPGGETTTYTYDAAGNKTSEADPDGNVTSYAYNARNQLTSQTDPDGNVTRYGYDAEGNQTSQTDPDGNTTGSAYDVNNRLVSTTDPAGGVTTYAYDPAGNKTSQTDPLGNVTEYTYDSDGNLTQTTDPTASNTSYAYDGDGNQISVTDPLGNITTDAYGSDGLLAAVNSPGGGVTSYAYDLAGNKVTQTDPDGNVTTYAYNADNQLTSQTDADGNTTSYAYNADGQRTSVTGPDGTTTSYAYDGDGRLASVTAPDGGKTSYAYDGDGNQVSRTDPDGNTWTTAYDGDGNQVSVTDPLGNTTSYTYDGDGNQATRTDGNGVTTTTTYDADSRPAKISYSDATPTVTYSYDADGNTTSVTGGTGTQNLAYDADGRVTSEAGFTYTYDADGDVTSRTYPDGTSAAYAYTPDGQVSQQATGSSATTYSYDPDGNLTSTAGPDGVTETRAYDPAGQLTSITDATASGTLDSWGMTLNSDGQPTQVTSVQDGAPQPVSYYRYDSTGRLTSACVTSGAESGCSAAAAGSPTGSAAQPAAPAGMVTDGVTGKCMDDLNAGQASGNPVDISTCGGSGSARQDWTAEPDGTVQAFGMCLDATGTTNSSLVDLATCDASAAQRWSAGEGGSLVNAASGLCLTDPSGSTTDGTQLQVYACNTSPQQHWRLPGTASGSATDGITGKCMDDLNAGQTSGNPVDISTCDGSSRQDWTISASGTVGVFGMCLDATGTSNSSLVDLASCDGTTAQQWAVAPGQGWMVNVASGLCLTDPSGSTTDGTQLQVYACNIFPQQDWRMPAPLPPAGSLTSAVTGMCLDDLNAAKTTGNPVDIATCNGLAAQQWTVSNDGEVQVFGMCLDAVGITDSTTVELDPCTGSTAQQWAAGPNGWLTSLASGLCLTDPDSSATSGTQLQISTCYAATGQQWTLPATTVPAQPAGLTATAGASSATLSWTPPVTSGGAPLDGYTVTSSGGQTATAGPNADTATITGLTAGTAYTFTLTADNGRGSDTTPPTSAITPGNQTTYTYDKAGNLTGRETDGLTTTSSYNPGEELTQTVTGTSATSYTYDSDGNQTSAGNTTYAYNAAGELTSTTTPAGTFTYTYDSRGNLSTTSLGGSVIQHTTWDLNNQLPMAAEDTAANGSTAADYLYNPDGTLDSVTTPAETDYAVSDWLGSVTGLVSPAGTQLSATTYSPYGTPSTTDLADGAPATSIGYAASYTLPGGTGLDDMRARDYNPATSQFTTIDPELPATGQPYTYAADNPVANTDPTGMESLEPAGIGSSNDAYSCAHLSIDCSNTPNSNNSSSRNSGCGGNSDQFPTGYNYFFQEQILPIAETGSPEEVMRSFQLDPEPVFPFSITGCSSFTPGVTCTLHVAPTAFNGVGKVRVSTAPTSFTFTVTSEGYFDSPGSNITFSVGQRGNYLYLSQHGVGYNSTLTGLAGGYLSFAEFEWYKQAANLRTLLAENFINEKYLGQPPVWGVTPTPVGTYV